MERATEVEGEHKHLADYIFVKGDSFQCVSCAYVYEENDFVYVKSFEQIPNYEINEEQKCIDDMRVYTITGVLCIRKWKILKRQENYMLKALAVIDLYEEAMRYLSEELAVYERDGGKDFHYSAVLVAMGDAHFSKQNCDEAVKYYQRG